MGCLVVVVVVHTRLGVRQTVSLRNTLISLNILACSSLLTYACGAFRSALRASILFLSEQHNIPVRMLDATGSGLLLNSGRQFSGDRTQPNPTLGDIRGRP